MENLVQTLVAFLRGNTPKFQSVTLLLLRLLFGFLFFQAGYGKLGHMEGVILFFTSLGIPVPAAQAYFVAYLEMIGGGLLIIGFATRIISFPLIITMLVALFTAHGDDLTLDLSGVVASAPFPYLMALLVIIFFGAGKYSLDRLTLKAAEAGNKGFLFGRIRCARGICDV